jgi:hypothetical protein
VLAVVALVVSVADVLEDLVLLLQPLRANPARIKVNNIGFFIGGLITRRLTPSGWFGSHRIPSLIRTMRLERLPQQHQCAHRSASLALHRARLQR